MLNKITIMGRLCADPELRKTASGISVCNARIAVERNYADQDGERETDFFNVVAWRGAADFLCGYFAKGRRVVLDGRLQTRNWTDRDGNKRVSVEIVAESVYFADSKPAAPAAENRYDDTPEASGYIPEEDEPAPAKGRKRKAA